MEKATQAGRVERLCKGAGEEEGCQGQVKGEQEGKGYFRRFFPRKGESEGY